MIGKRKREGRTVSETPKATSTTSENSGEAAAEGLDNIFRSYFEARFAPLEPTTQPTPPEATVDEETSDAESDVSEWSGISGDVHDVPVVEVIDHARSKKMIEDDVVEEKTQQKMFMSSKPPRRNESKPVHKGAESTEDDPLETIHLKHDLDLQRLLKESKLLEESKASSAPGKQRHMATDMRLQELGSKESLFTQQNMPLSHRRGITAKAMTKEAMRRKNAQENGIVLEKATKKSSTSNARRERGVDVPAIGRFRGGTLQLSRTDIASMQGPRPSRGKRGRR